MISDDIPLDVHCLIQPHHVYSNVRFHVGSTWNTRSVFVGNMPGYGLCTTHIFPYTNRIVDYVLILEDTSQRSPYSGIFYAICSTTQNVKVFI